jgi:hypothetical protein
VCTAVLLILLLLAPGLLAAQGQDSTPAERNLQIIAALLPGRYDNANQVYFDQRLAVPEDRRPVRTTLRVEALADGAATAFVYHWHEGGAERTWTTRLAAAADPERVAMAIRFDDGSSEDCVVEWRRDAGQFDGIGDCGLELQLAPSGLWISWDGKRPNRLLRAREFSCYVDIPGVAGGRDEPFDRYLIDTLHDQGGLEWLTTKDGREIGINLRRVRWPMNNERGAFTRDSLVMYVLERDADGVRTHSYGWTEPDAARIGLNLQWLLVNCYLVSNRDAKPTFD